MGIKINDLSPVGANLFADSESFMGNIRSLSEDELKVSGGDGYGKGGYGSDSGSGGYGKGGGSDSGSGGYGCGCGYHC